MKFQSGAHRAHLRIGNKTFAMLWVPMAKAFRNQQFHTLVQQFFLGITKEPSGLLVDQNDLAGRIDHHHSIGGRIEQCLEIPRQIDRDRICPLRHLYRFWLSITRLTGAARVWISRPIKGR